MTTTWTNQGGRRGLCPIKYTNAPKDGSNTRHVVPEFSAGVCANHATIRVLRNRISLYWWTPTDHHGHIDIDRKSRPDLWELAAGSIERCTVHPFVDRLLEEDDEQLRPFALQLMSLLNVVQHHPDL